MKVDCVSGVKFTSGNYEQLPFLYTSGTPQKTHFQEHKKEYLGGLAGVAIAGIALWQIFGRNRLPKNVVELADANIGLNKIQDCEKAISVIKDKILYPLKVVQSGDKRILNEDFTKGLIIVGGETPNKADELVNALMEHAKALKIPCLTPAKAETKRDVMPNLHRAIDAATICYHHTGQCTILNVGELELFSRMNPSNIAARTTLEKRLYELPPGIIWVAKTNKGKRLPYFHNTNNVLITKLS